MCFRDVPFKAVELGECFATCSAVVKHPQTDFLFFGWNIFSFFLDDSFDFLSCKEKNILCNDENDQFAE